MDKEDLVDLIVPRTVAEHLLTFEPLTDEHSKALRDAAAVSLGAIDNTKLMHSEVEP